LWLRASVYLCVCLCVCLSAAVRPHYRTNTDVTWGHGRGCPLIVHCWADLQSGHWLYRYDNITQTLVTSLRPSHDMTTMCERCAGSARPAGQWPASDGGRSQHYCGGLDCGLPMVAFWRHNANATC